MSTESSQSSSVSGVSSSSDNLSLSSSKKGSGTKKKRKTSSSSGGSVVTTDSAQAAADSVTSDDGRSGTPPLAAAEGKEEAKENEHDQRQQLQRRSAGHDDEAKDEDDERSSDRRRREAIAREAIARGRLAEVNGWRKAFGHAALPDEEEHMEWVLENTIDLENPQDAFFPQEWQLILKNGITPSHHRNSRKDDSEKKERKRHDSHYAPASSDDDIDAADDETDPNDAAVEHSDDPSPKDDEDPGAGSTGGAARNTTIKPELAALLPPSWAGPWHKVVEETTVEKERRVADEALWSKVPRLVDQEARNTLIKLHAFTVSKTGTATKAGVRMPKEVDPSKDLASNGVIKKSNNDSNLRLLCDTLTKQLPTAVRQNTDVIRVLLTAMNSWSARTSENNLKILTDVVLPLLIDNNLRTTDAIQRTTIKVCFPQLAKLPEDKGFSSSAVSDSPLMQRVVAASTDKTKMLKAITQAGSSSSSTTSFRGRDRGNSFTRPRFRANNYRGGRGSSGSGSGGRGSSSSFPRRGGSRGGSSSSRGGRGSYRGGGSKPFSSSSSSTDKSPI
jgi:hypothetical protein